MFAETDPMHLLASVASVTLTGFFLVMGLLEQLRSLRYTFAPSRASRLAGALTRRVNLDHLRLQW